MPLSVGDRQRSVATCILVSWPMCCFCSVVCMVCVDVCMPTCGICGIAFVYWLGLSRGFDCLAGSDLLYAASVLVSWGLSVCRGSISSMLCGLMVAVYVMGALPDLLL